MHRPDTVNVLFTNTLENGRQSLFKPCPNRYDVKEKICDKHPSLYTSAHEGKLALERNKDHVGCDVFKRTKEDEKLAPSVEDLTFINIMKQGFYKDEDNSWVAPLPFKQQRCRLPNNKTLVLDRFRSLQRSLNKKPEMKEHFFGFMKKILEKGNAEVAPPLSKNEECWYLPLFGVYHPRKPGQI